MSLKLLDLSQLHDGGTNILETFSSKVGAGNVLLE
jgi:hypothetical protein